MTKILIGLLLASVAPAMATDAQTWESAGPVLIAAVDVDNSGHVTHAAPIGSNSLPQLQVLVAQTVSHWRFQPASINGEPATARTFVRFEPQMHRHDNQIELRLKYDGHGAGWALRNQPRYPSRMIGLMTEADVLMAATVQPDGTYGDIHPVSARTTAGVKAADFYQELARTIATWRALPEEVDGQAVMTHVTIPFTFRLNSDGDDVGLARLRWAADTPTRQSQPAADYTAAYASLPISLDSPIRLLAIE